MNQPLPPLKTSACPVHFIWDGHGAGRWPVRLGFWLMTGLLGVAPLLRLAGVVDMAVLAWPAGGLVLLWCLGQVLSQLEKRRHAPV